MFVAKWSRAVYVEYYAQLGNQLFQYAAGYALAKRLGYDLVHVDSNYEATNHGGKPSVHRFGISGRAASTVDFLLAYMVTGRTAARLCGPLSFLLPELLDDREDGWDARFAQVKRPVYLRGYWQSYRYFQNDAPDILEHLRPRDALSALCAEAAENLRSPYTVAMHVRRGDYISNEEYSKTFVSHSDNYYQRAVDLFGAMGRIHKIMVFSDDPEWCRNHLKFDVPMEIAPPPVKGDWEHLWLMSQASRIITAASSFSWWAGWLSHPRGGHVIAPKIWRQRASAPPKDLLPTTWTVV